MLTNVAECFQSKKRLKRFRHFYRRDHNNGRTWNLNVLQCLFEFVEEKWEIDMRKCYLYLVVQLFPLDRPKFISHSFMFYVDNIYLPCGLGFNPKAWILS